MYIGSKRKRSLTNARFKTVRFASVKLASHAKSFGRYSMAFYIAAQNPFEPPNKAHGLLMFSKLYSSQL
jgi:hypothetical protein